MSLAADATVLTEEARQFVNDGCTIRVHVARPADRPGRFPAVILLHEWWGLTPHAADVARRLARAGYVGAALDLYSRQGHAVTADPAEAARLMNALSTQAALRDLNACARYLAALPFVDGQRLGILGFSMGGGIALFMAQHNSDLKAAAAFYGKTPPVETADAFLCPILFHDAGQDAWVTRKEVDALRQALAGLGKPATFLRYPEADHAFFNDARPEVYRRADAERAWQSTLAFFKRYLV